MLGIHGVLRYSVTTRKQEIGVRMALGASRGEIYRLIFGQVGTPVFAGLAAGLLATILAGRVVKKLLYGAQSIDLPVALAVSTLFLAAAFAAGFFPARQAASVDPMTSLRAE